jgi:carboxypeptidase T
MKPIRIAWAFVSLCCLPMLAAAQNVYSTVKIYAPTDKTERAELLGRLQIDHYNVRDGALVAEIGQEEVAYLKSSKYRYEVVVPDIHHYIDSLNQIYEKSRNDKATRSAFNQVGDSLKSIIPTPSAFVVQTGFGGYYTFVQMEAAMTALASTYPTIVTKTSLGKSVDNNDIWCIKISDNVSTDEANEPEVLFMGLQHAREAIGGSSMIFFMQFLCEQYTLGNTKIMELVNNREIYIIPCMNPDGWLENQSTNASGGGGWRKNRKQIATSGGGQYGVDLNRNWGIDWGNCTGASSSCGSSSKTSGNETYWGLSAFSEPETQAVRDFAKSKHLSAMIDQHAYGPYYSLPFGRPTLHPQPDSLTTQEQNFYSLIPALMGTYNGMRAGNSIQSVGYEVAGGVKDWMLRGDIGTSIGTGYKGSVYGMTGEGGAGDGSGGTYGSFWAPKAEIINLCRGMIYQNIQLALAAGSYVDVQDVNDIAVSATSGSFNYKVKRIGLSDETVTVTLIPIENVLTVGSPAVIGSIPTYAATSTGNISYTLSGSVASGSRIRYAWKVTTGGINYYDTVVKYFTPTTVFYDNMEGTLATNWTVSGGFAYSTDGAYAGSKSLTESPGGNYTGSSTRTATYTGSLDLSDAIKAHMTFWIKHRSENFRDKLQVQISINNGTTWLPIAGSTTVQEHTVVDESTIDGKSAFTGWRTDWTPELFDLSSYTSNYVKLRFVFTSDATGSGYDFENDDGFYIDELKVVKTISNTAPLAVKFLDFTGHLKEDHTVQLNWNADVSNDHDYFEVQRSAEGMTFSTLGKSATTAPYSFIDKDPMTDVNYYRIKQVDKNGNFTYSKVIRIELAAQTNVTIFPNPVRDQLMISLHNERTGLVQVEVLDVTGHRVFTGRARIDQAAQQLHFDVRHLKPQAYIVRVLDAAGNVIATEKLMKL